MVRQSSYILILKWSWMKQANCSLLAEGFELLLEVQVRDPNETLRLGLLEHRVPPILFGAIYLLANPEKIGHRIGKTQRGVRATIALKPSDEMLEILWGNSGAACRRRHVRGSGRSAGVRTAGGGGWGFAVFGTDIDGACVGSGSECPWRAVSDRSR